MQQNQLRFSALVALIFTLLVGCTSAPKHVTGTSDRNAQNNKAKLMETAIAFNQYVRWRETERAAQFVEAGQERNTFLREMRKEIKSTKIMEIHIVNVELDDENISKGTVNLSVTLVRDTNVLETTEDQSQSWHQATSGAWYLDYAKNKNSSSDKAGSP